MDKEWFEFDPVDITLKDLPVEGLILDIGGGGEGAIGRLRGKDVIALDIRKDELDEIPDGPQKLVMDARSLGFEEGIYSAVTALFSLMYITEPEDQVRVFEEVGRVMKPGGRFFLWDVALNGETTSAQPNFIVFVRYHLRDAHWGTGYGARFPKGKRDESYYKNLATRAGFRLVDSQRNQHVFHLAFEKLTG